MDSLLNSIILDALKVEIKAHIDVYVKLATILRDLNETADRRATKISLDRLYAEASEQDGHIVEIFHQLDTEASGPRAVFLLLVKWN